MNKSISVLGVLLCLGLQGCVSSPFNYTPKISIASEPSLNELETVSVGEPLMKQGLSKQYDAIEIEKGTQIINTVFDGVEVNNTLIKAGEDENYSYYRVSRKNDLAFLGFLKVNKVNQSACILQIIGKDKCTDSNTPIKYKMKNVNVFTPDSLQQVLYYNGKVGTKINIGYREFFNNMARPAFNNDVEYDLKESNTIAYKGALINVISADNQSITYKIIKSFN